MVKLSI